MCFVVGDRNGRGEHSILAGGGMEVKRIIEVARWPIAVAIGVWLFHWAESSMRGAEGWRPDVALEIVNRLLLYGILLFLLFGQPFIVRVAAQFERLFWPADSDLRIVPEYSVAEARVKQGRYEEAVEEYRKVIVLHPTDVYAHVRIADLAIDKLHDLKLAEAELLSAVSKAESGDTVAITAHRLADLYEHLLHDHQRALDALRVIPQKLPTTKHAKAAEQRIKSLLSADSTRSAIC